ncbi:response regulator transcription factor [Flavobacterium cerinum]|uniref:Response regulator transcription factor n=1 Tax=Flavobacterium cerinum TaxID=2502784 RepID=A0A3S3RCZ2_9FLAO|nr:response regulator transcription factor [Flavobacterium cerinum]RWW91724.1 response regulator transcription factor [Flavobacterium cerinum]
MNILIVEDQSGIFSFLKQGLEEEGYSVDIAEDGAAGLIKAKTEDYSLILLDWMLPKITGLELCIEIRKTNKLTPIIFLTAKDTLEDTIKGLNAGANDYIKKPFSFEELLARINVQLRGTTNLKTEYVLDTIVLKTLTHQIFNNGQEIHLTQKEFLLLEYLLKNRGKICTREDIIKNVWNIYFDYDTSIIDVYMNGIRKKLGLRKDNKLIKTVRGIGYIVNDID